MINSKETLKKLHKKFPLMTLDELFEILDCYTEGYEPTKIWYDSGIKIAPYTTDPYYKSTTITCNGTSGIKYDLDSRATASNN